MPYRRHPVAWGLLRKVGADDGILHLCFDLLLQETAQGLRMKASCSEMVSRGALEGKLYRDVWMCLLGGIHRALLMGKQFANGLHKLRCVLVYSIPSGFDISVSPVHSTTQCGHPERAQSALLELERFLKVLWKELRLASTSFRVSLRSLHCTARWLSLGKTLHQPLLPCSHTRPGYGVTPSVIAARGKRPSPGLCLVSFHRTL